MPIIVETPDRTTGLPFIFLWIDVLDSVASVWIKGGSHRLCYCPAAPNLLPMKPAGNRRVNPPLVTHRDIHTAHGYKYTPPYTHIHTKSQAHHGDGGCGKRLRAPNRCPPARPEPGHASVMPGCPGLPLGALIHCFHLLPGYEGQRCQNTWAFPILSLSIFQSLSKPAISAASTYQSAVRGKLYIIGITQCPSFSFKHHRN